MECSLGTKDKPIHKMPKSEWPVTKVFFLPRLLIQNAAIIFSGIRQSLDKLDGWCAK